jgi:heme/copper-type cytochrome/quinol oxidase subunit 2
MSALGVILLVVGVIVWSVIGFIAYLILALRGDEDDDGCLPEWLVNVLCGPAIWAIIIYDLVQDLKMARQSRHKPFHGRAMIR